MNTLSILTPGGPVLVEASPISEDAVHAIGAQGEGVQVLRLEQRGLQGFLTAIDNRYRLGWKFARAWVGVATFRLLKDECAQLARFEPKPSPPPEPAELDEGGMVTIEQHNAIVRQKDELIASLRLSLDGRNADVKGLVDQVRLLTYGPAAFAKKAKPPPLYPADEDLLAGDA